MMRRLAMSAAATAAFGLVLFLAASAGCRDKTKAPAAPAAAPPAQDNLTVFAAASLTESFNELARQFEKDNPGVKVTCQYAGSQQLLAQLDHGARADVFASASPKEMNAAIEGKLVRSDAPRVFARNRMVVIRSNKATVSVSSLADLAKPDVRVILADQTVPIGRYTTAMLAKAQADPAYGPGFADKVKSRVVSYELNVKVVLNKVRLGEADAGVVYVTDVTRQAARDVSVIEIPTPFNEIATYPIAPLINAAAPELAGRFLDFLVGPDGQETLASFGFMPVATSQPDRP